MKQKKDILFLCQFFYPEYISSATLPTDTAIALSKAGFSVGVLCGYAKEYNLEKDVPIKEIYKGIEIKRLKYNQKKRNSKIGRLINYFSFTMKVVLNFNQFRKYKSVIVYSNPPILPIIPALANKFFGTKVIFVSYDIYPEMAYITKSISENGIISKIMKWANKIIFSRVEKVVALSNEMKNYLLDYRKTLSEEQIVVIPNWFEDKIKQNKINDIKNDTFKTMKQEGNLIISYFGNMGICQDIDTIIDAIRQLKDNNNIKFIFAGHGNKMNYIKDIVKEENLDNVKIFDFLHGQDFEDALNISDCFIVSLIDGLTGLCVPSKTYSYMMAGKPILAIMGQDSDISRDLIQNNCGYTIEPGNHLDLVEAIEELYNDRNKIKQMGQNCRRVFMEKYTKEKCTQKYVSLIKTVLEEK